MQKAIRDEEEAIAARCSRTLESDTDPDSDAEPAESGPRGQGLPLRVGSFERARDLCDGAGLCSLGRWPPSSRPSPSSRRLLALNAMIGHTMDAWLQRASATAQEVFQQLADGEATEETVPGEVQAELYHKALSIFADIRGGAQPRTGDLPMLVHGRLLETILTEGGDPDKRGIKHFYQGVRLGVGRKTPRTPAVFAKKTKWNLAEQGTASDLAGQSVQAVWRDNYQTVKAHPELILQQLEDHHARGLALRLTPKEAREQYPDLTVVSLGAVAKVADPQSPEDLRLLMDGTHGVCVNSHIRQRDQDRCPTAADVKRVQRAQGQESRRPRGLALDAKEAHRIPPVHPEDWRFLGCRASLQSDIFIYKYGVFGIATSAYWWARLGGALVRACHLVALPSQALWLLLMADDLKVESTAEDAERQVLWLILFLLMLGVPLSWRKVQGGDEITWIGYSVRLKELSLGISSSRASWAVTWLRRHATNGMGCIEEFASALGRLAFICGALEYDRPFLSPLFAYKAKQSARGLKVYPMFVRLIMNHLAERIARRHHYPSAEARHPSEPFRVDAAAEGEYIAIGGWLPAKGEDGSIDTHASDWFSVQLCQSDAPWAFDRGLPYKAIASLEALAALVGLLVFGPAMGKHRDLTLTVPGYTDNRSNRYALTRLQSCKFPLCVLVMELSAQLESRSQRLAMTWAPREINREADRLANGDTRGFSAGKRQHFSMNKAAWLVLPELMAEGRAFDEHRRQLQAQQSSKRTARTKRNKLDSIRVTQPW